MANLENCLTPIQWAVREISEALGVACRDPADRLKALLEIRRVIAPVQDDPVGLALDEEAMRLGHEHGLCSKCARPLVRIGDESFCVEHDWRLLAMRLRKEAI
ncbi:MAG: hypothetical protein ACM309_02715 [Bacillota bacterium]